MSTETMSVEEEARVVEQIREGREKIRAELSKVDRRTTGGHRATVDLPVRGRALPDHRRTGLAKTLLVRSVAQIFHLKFQRIQFTPDLMPADITGTEILEQDTEGRAAVAVRERTDLCQRDLG